jgi:hypothetical protein
VGHSGENCPQHCKQDLPKNVGEAAHAVKSPVSSLGYMSVTVCFFCVYLSVSLSGFFLCCGDFNVPPNCFQSLCVDYSK